MRVMHTPALGKLLMGAFLFFLFVQEVKSQSQDSLTHALQMEADVQKRLLILKEITATADRNGSTDSTSLLYYRNLIQTGRAIGDSLTVAEGWLYVGFYHYLVDDILLSTRAYQSAQTSLQLVPKNHLLHGRLNSSLAINYISLGSYTLALGRLRLALPITTKYGRLEDRVDILDNLRSAFSKLHVHDSSTYYARMSVESYKVLLSQKPNSSYFSLGVGKGLLELGNVSEAIVYFEKALAICEAANNKSGIKSCHQYLGTSYYELKAYSKAKDHFLKSLLYEGNHEYIAHQRLSDIASIEGNYDEAYHHLKAYDSASQELATNIREQVFNMEQLFQDVEKERDLLKVQNEASTAKGYVYLLVSLLFVAVSTLTFFLILYRQRSVGYKNLKEKNREIEEVRAEIEKKRNLLEQYHKALINLSKDESLFDQGQQYLFNGVCRTAAETLNVNRVSIWVLEKGNSCIARKFLYELGSGTDELLILERKYFPAYFKALESKPFIVATNAREHPDTAEFTEGYLKPLDIYSMLDCAIVIDRKPIGVICCEHQHELKVWNTEDELFIQSLSDLIAKSYRNERIKDLLAEVEGKNYELVSKNNEIETMNEELASLNESLEATVSHRTKELEERNTQLTEYAFINSHLLRAPLSRILGLSHLIARDIRSVEDAKLIEALLTSSNELDSIIRRISDVLYDGKNMTREDIKSMIERNLNQR